MVWNLYVLPPLVVLALVRAALRGRIGPLAGRARTVRLIGLLNLGLAARALVVVAPEFVAKYRYGAFPSLAPVHVFWPLLGAAVQAPIGLGLVRLQPWARWTLVVWSALALLFSIVNVVFIVQFQAAVALWEWPDQAVAKLLPAFCLVVMLLPRTARACAARPEADAPQRPSLVALLTIGFAVVLVSVLATDLLVVFTQFTG